MATAAAQNLFCCSGSIAFRKVPAEAAGLILFEDSNELFMTTYKPSVIPSNRKKKTSPKPIAWSTQLSQNASVGRSFLVFNPPGSKIAIGFFQWIRSVLFGQRNHRRGQQQKLQYHHHRFRRPLVPPESMPPTVLMDVFSLVFFAVIRTERLSREARGNTPGQSELPSRYLLTAISVIVSEEKKESILGTLQSWEVEQESA